MSALHAQVLLQTLPSPYVEQAKSLEPDLLDAITRFVLGCPCSSDASPEVVSTWEMNQAQAFHAFEQLRSQLYPPSKRTRDDDGDPTASTSIETEDRLMKKLKSTSASDARTVDPNDTALYTIHAISVTSPIRKKVNVAIHRSSIQLTHPSTNAVEFYIPISQLKRAFLLPTKSKTKPHWTVIILSQDTTSPKSAPGSKDESTQIIFGLDEKPTTTMSITDHESGPITHPKGTSTLAFLKKFLSFLPFPPLLPSTAIFKSAVAPAGTIPEQEGIVACIEGYRGAKPGALWFFAEGVLWDTKPAEFWPLESLKGMGSMDIIEGVRTVSATGRTCSVIVSRKIPGEDDEDEDEYIESDVGMVDGREQDPVGKYVKRFGNLFGKPFAAVANGATPSDPKGKGKAKAVDIPPPADDDSDDPEDEDFQMDSEDEDGGSPSASSGSENGEGGAESVAEDASDTDEDDEMDPKHHPLLRPGALPSGMKISKAAIEAAVGIVEKDLLGGGSASKRGDVEMEDSDGHGDEEDELDE